MVKKQLIMEKALELFAEQGFEATSIQQITERSGISKGAFYLSFKSKDELIFALIDYFMMQIVADIDSSVKSCSNKEQMLYEFYSTNFRTFKSHSSFAKIFIQEQMQVNEELFLKYKYYDNLINKTILYMIEQLYLDTIKRTKYDLLICIKGFIKTYAELYLLNLPIDIDVLTRSLVEKTNILAMHSTISFITEDMVQAISAPLEESITKEQLALLIDQKIQEIDHVIEKESLELLKETLFYETPSLAIIKGLLGNIKNNVKCKWISYLIREHYKL